MLIVGDPHRGAAWAAPRAVLPADQFRRPRLQPLGAGAGGAVAFGEQALRVLSHDVAAAHSRMNATSSAESLAA